MGMWTLGCGIALGLIVLTASTTTMNVCPQSGFVQINLACLVCLVTVSLVRTMVVD